MRRPTEPEINRAARTLAALANVESLQGGICVFRAEGLAGGWPYGPGGQDGLVDQGLENAWLEFDTCNRHLWTTIPNEGGLSGERLLAACRAELALGIERRQRELAMWRRRFERAGEPVGQVVEWSYDETNAHERRLAEGVE